MRRMKLLWLDMRVLLEPSFLWMLLRLALRRMLRRQGPCCCLMATPRHSNLGDQAIALGELRYFQDQGVKLCEFSEMQLHYMLYYLRPFLRWLLPQDAMLYLHGGGCLGDLYPLTEQMRRDLLHAFPHHRICILPQSFYVDSEASGRAMAALYDACDDLTILLRDETSFALAQAYFTRCSLRLVPDAATYLQGRFPIGTSPKPPIDLLCLKRRDKENHYDAASFDAVIRELEKTWRVERSDTVLPPEPRVVGKRRRTALVRRKLQDCARARVVVTDRFHGMVFSVLAGTPCVVLRSLDHKIVAGARWFSGTGRVQLIDSLAALPGAVRAAMALDQGNIERTERT
ncbi:MAG: polysaccharide pyruvyl transferase family protein [Oscillospiraceae bacterium]|jgi:pyruvyl transferase EpsI|nr:polysaccharide pyruvyl transferase family protein [Oscillospiraceae bacterium]